MTEIIQRSPINGHELSEVDTMAAFCDGLKRAASCAREMGALLQDPTWAKTADMMDMIRDNGMKLARMRAMTKLEVEQALNLKTAQPSVH